MASTYLTRTMSGNSNQRVFTLSAWVKRNGLGRQVIMGVGGSGSYAMELYFQSGNQIDWWNYFNNSYAGRKVTNRKFRDINAWYHIVARWDTTDSTAANRMRLYVNGVEETSFSTDSNPSQNTTSEWNSGSVHEIGRNGDSSYCFDGAMSHIHFVDGSSLAPTVFGETDSTTGEWQINASPSFTPGSNGFTILKDGNTVTDQSANSNDFSVAAGTLTDLKDCPSNIFATLNTLTKSASALTINKGNNSKGSSSSNSWRSVVSNLGVSTGKYYFEIKVDNIESSDPNNFAVGITDYEQSDNQSSTNGKFFAFSRGYGYYAGNGKKVNNDSAVANGVAYGDSFTTGDIVGCAFDLDNGKIYFSKNGTWQNSGDPTSGSTGTGSAFNITTGYTYFPVMAQYYSAEQYSFNFGNGYFGTTAVSSAGTNASGIGIFEYDVPTGYTALSTKGLNL